MIIKEQINVKDDRLIDGLTPVVRIMGQVEGAADQEGRWFSKIPWRYSGIPWRFSGGARGARLDFWGAFA